MTNSNQNRTFLQSVTNESFVNNMKDVYTAIPGHILTFDPLTQRAQVQVGIARVDEVTRTTMAPPPIVDVPVSFPGGDFSLEYQIDPGTEGMIHFSQRCMDAWKVGGEIANNPIKRFHHKQDAVFVPGIRSLNNIIVGFSNEGMKMRNKDASSYVWVRADSSVRLETGKAHILMDKDGNIAIESTSGTVTVNNGVGKINIDSDGTINLNGVTIDKNGKLTVPSSMSLAGKEMAGHTHGNVQNGDGQTGANI